MTIHNGFCCERMMYATGNMDCPLQYIPKLRSYIISAPVYLLKEKKVRRWPRYAIEYCPFCGTKLPKNLRVERLELLKKEYGITDPYDAKQQKRIPQEFMTDEWWKNRGL